MENNNYKYSLFEDAFGYNFRLKPLIENFDFYEFCDKSIKEIDTSGFELRGFLVITNKQYVLGYTAGFGYGEHQFAYARVMKDLYGGGEINPLEGEFLESKLNQNFIIGRIAYGPWIIKDKIKYSGYIHFGTIEKISYEQYEQFLKFYEKYNEDIKYVCKKFNFSVQYYYYDDRKKVKSHHSNSLDDLKDELVKHLCESNYNDEDEIILNEARTK